MSQAEAIILATLISLTVGYVTGRRSEFRAAHRKVLGEHVDELARAIHETVATSNVIFKRVRRGESWNTWYDRAQQAAEDLKTLRRKLRYPLWGFDNALRSLTRLPDWLGHVREDREGTKELLERADRLRDLLDTMIRRAYLRGRPPTPLDRVQVWWAERRYAAHFDELMEQSRDTTSESP